MIAVIVVGVGLLVVVAVVVGILDAAQAAAWRAIAAQRRELWEARQSELHAPIPGDVDGWDAD